jgi:hypothetical protein
MKTSWLSPTALAVQVLLLAALVSLAECDPDTGGGGGGTIDFTDLHTFLRGGETENLLQEDRVPDARETLWMNWKSDGYAEPLEEGQDLSFDSSLFRKLSKQDMWNQMVRTCRCCLVMSLLFVCNVI